MSSTKHFKMKHKSYTNEFDIKNGKKVGSGTFGAVYKVRRFDSHKDDSWYALKKMKRTETSHDEKRILREVQVLQELKDAPNIIPLLGVLPSPKTGKPQYLVFPYIEPRNPTELFGTLGAEYVRHFMYQLIVALYTCHGKKIIHGDIKSRNLLIDLRTNTLYLIDFGQARYSNQTLTYHVGTPSYKAPELLYQASDFTTAVDIFSAGRVFLDMLMPESHDGDDEVVDTFDVGSKSTQRRLKQLNFWGMMLGGKDLKKMAQKLHAEYPFRGQTKYDLHRWLMSLNPRRFRSHCSREALNLLDRMLEVNPKKRITAAEALVHPYFQMGHIQEPSSPMSRQSSPPPSPNLRAHGQPRDKGNWDEII